VQHPLFVDKYLLAIVIGSGGRDPRRGGDHEEGKQEVAEIEDLRPHVVHGWNDEKTPKRPHAALRRRDGSCTAGPAATWQSVGIANNKCLAP